MEKTSTHSLLNKMLLRSFKKAWAQFLAVIAIGAIAVTLFVGLLANAQSFENRVNEVYSEGNLASLWVTTTRYEKEDQEMISSFLEEGEEMDGRLYLPCEANAKSVYLAVVPSFPQISKPYGEMELSNMSTDTDFVYFDKELKSKTNNLTGSSAFILNQDVPFYLSLASYGLNKYASYVDPYLKDGKTNIFKEETICFHAPVTGFMNFPENITKSSYNTSLVLMSDSMFKKGLRAVVEENFNEAGTHFIFAALEAFLGFNSLDSETLSNPNQYLISVKEPGRVAILKDKINQYFASKEDNNLYLTTSRSEMPFYVTINNDVTQARQFTFVFPFVFFAVAILVILTTLSQRVLQERSQIGTMKAIGLKKSQIYWHYIRLTCLLVGIGTFLGEVLGPLIVPWKIKQKYSILYSLPTLRYTFPILEGILTAVVFLGISSLVTFLICHKEVSLKPVDSMRPEPPKMKLRHIHQSKKEKVSMLSLKMALRNIRINKVKSLMVIIGVMGCTALLSCGFGIEDTIDYGIEHDFSIFYNTDLAITFKNTMSKENMVSTLLKYPEIKEVEPYASGAATAYMPNGPQSECKIYLMQEDGDTIHLNFDHDKVVITQKISTKTGAKAGDVLHFQYNSLSYEAEVAFVQDAFVYHGIYCYTDAPFLKNAPSLSYNTAYVKVKENTDIDQLAKRMRKNTDTISNVTTAKIRNAMIQDVMSGVKVMTNAVKVFAILLAIVVLYNLALMNFKERTRDIATLKVLGFSRNEISLSLLFETMSLTAVGVLFGLALGYPFMLGVLGTNVVELVEYLYCIKALSYFLSFVLTFVVAFMVNLLLTKRIRKVLMAESLKSVE